MKLVSSASFDLAPPGPSCGSGQRFLRFVAAAELEGDEVGRLVARVLRVVDAIAANTFCGCVR